MPQVDECVRPGEPPGDYVRRLAETKARAALRLLDSPPAWDTLIVAADTAVVDVVAGSSATIGRLGAGAVDKAGVRYTILGKPLDAADAERVLRRLRGRTHQVYTAVAVLRPRDGVLSSAVVVTDVSMRNYSEEEMLAYVASGDPLDKAGAYAIQHNGFRPVEGLSGCYANVMGLPVCHLARLLDGFGAPAGADIPQACQGALDYPCPIFRQVLAAA